MNTKLLIGVAAVLVLGGAYFFMNTKESNAPVVGDYRWELTAAGEDEIGAPRTSVSLISGGTVFSVGTYQGTCSEIGGESAWELQERERSGVICWYAGGGKEIGVFEQNGEFYVRVGDLDEGTAEEPGFRGNFQDLFKIEAKPATSA